MKLSHLMSATCAVVLSIGLVGCGNAPAAKTAPKKETKSEQKTSEEGVTRADADLVIWADQKRADALQDIAKQFGKDNNIKVAVQAVSTSLDTNFITADAAGNGPDVVVQGDDKIASFVQNGSIVPVQLSSEEKKKLVPEYLSAVQDGGQTYGVPYAAEGLILYRNTDLAPDAPQTFDDLVAQGQKLVYEKKADRVISLQVGDTGDAFHMQPLYASMGGYLIGGESGKPDTKDIGIAKDGALKFARKLSELGEKGSKVLTRSVSSQNSISLFAQGKTPYLISGSWARADIEKAGLHYAASVIPGFAGEGPARPFMSVQAFYVAAHGKNKTLAEEFVNNVVPQESTQEKLYSAEARPPALASLLEKKAASDEVTRILSQAAKQGVVRPKIPQLNSVWDPMGKAEASIVGGANPEEAMKSAAQAVEDALK